MRILIALALIASLSGCASAFQPACFGGKDCSKRAPVNVWTTHPSR